MPGRGYLRRARSTIVTMGSTNSPAEVSGRARRKSLTWASRLAAFGRFHHQQVGVGGHGGQQRVRRAPLPVPELPGLDRLEPGRSGGQEPLLPGPGAALPPAQQRDAGLALAHGRQCRDPAHPVVVHVPQSGQHAARRQHPGQLGQGPVQVEPVHGLAGQHGVDGAVGQRDLFRAAGHGPHRAEPAAQFGQHAGIGFHRGDVGAQADQGFGQLAGSRGQVEHPQRPAGADRLQGPADGGLGVIGPVLGVGRRGGAERRSVPQPVFSFFLALRAGQVIHSGHPMAAGAWRRRRRGPRLSRAGGCPPSSPSGRWCRAGSVPWGSRCTRPGAG